MNLADFLYADSDTIIFGDTANPILHLLFLNTRSSLQMHQLNFVRQLDTHKIKCISLNNEPCLARLTLMDLNTYELHYHPFMLNSDRCNGNCNTLDDATAMIFDVSDK